jgi:hypothetical protein
MRVLIDPTHGSGRDDISHRNIIGLYYTGLLNAVELSVHLHG